MTAPILVRDEGRALATVARIDGIAGIPGADRIVAATVRGWTVVVGKGEFEVGQRVVFFEIDTALPVDDQRYAFLAPRGTKTYEGRDYHVLKTARLRGVYSQGLVLPLSLFFKDGAPEDGLDLTDRLDLYKWEQPLPAGQGQQAGPFTLLARKTDSERVQNLADAWPSIQQFHWYATEKVDGTSITIVRDYFGKHRVMSRNWEIAEGDNLYWRAAYASGLMDGLSYGDAIQGEIVGPGIQGNRLGLSDVRVVVFDGWKDGQLVSRGFWGPAALALRAPRYDIPFPATPEEAVTQVDGIKSLLSPGHLAEGVVWHTMCGNTLRVLDGRSTFKVVSNKYLLKEK